MSQLNEIYDNERIEKDTFRSMRELSKYSKILSKDNNLFVIIKKAYHQIKLSSSKSLFKISLLLDTLPEETVSFTFYTEEKADENIKTNDNIIINNINKDNKKAIKRKKVTESFYILDKIENNKAEEIYNKGKGNIIGYNYNLFMLIWKYLYLINLIISLISIISFSVYSLNSLLRKEYFILFSNIITAFSLCLSIFASNSGYKKIKSKKKVNFRLENIILICFLHTNAFCGIFWIYIFHKNETEDQLYVILAIEIILGFIEIICSILIWLNIQMMEFYRAYYDLKDEGIPLVEV